MAHPQHIAAMPDGSALPNEITNGYGYHQPQLTTYPGQTYHSADGTQAYTVDEYGRGTYWQLPAAPRLPSAAARGWNDSAHGYQPMNTYAPWAAIVPQHPPLPSHHHHAYHQPPQPAQPRQHRDIEQQMMLRHHLAKLQDSQQAGYDPHHAPHHAHAQYDPVYPNGTAFSAAGGGDQADLAHNGWSHHHALSDQQSRSRLPSGPDLAFHNASSIGSGHEPRYPYDSFQPPALNATGPYPSQQALLQQQPVSESTQRDMHHGTQHHWPPNQTYDRRYHDSVPRGEQPSAHDWSWHQQQQQHQQAYNRPPAQQSFHRSHTASGPYACASDGRLVGEWQGQEHGWHQPQDTAHQPLQAAQHGQHRGHWEPPGSYHGNHGARPGPIVAADVHQQQPYDPQTQAAGRLESSQNADAGPEKPPGPPSPETLDKSGVPLSTFGAELIWHACAVLSEPELLLEADSDDGTSPSSGSTNSSPMLSTPHTSPHSPCANSNIVEAPSSLMSSMELEPTATEGSKMSLANVSDGVHMKNRPGAMPSDVQAKLSAHEAANSSPMQLSSPTSPSAPGNGKHLSAREGLVRTKSRERSKAAILSVLGLVPAQMPWTTAEEKLPSLAQTPSRRSFDTGSRGPRSGSPRESAALGLSINGEVNPAFRRFAHQVLAQTLLSPTAFLLALLYALRVPRLAIDSFGNVDAEALEVFASPPSAAPFKLFTLGLMIANKHLDDNTFLNKTWNEVTGIPLAELNRMEQYYLMHCNYEISIPEQTWSYFLCAVRQREQAKVAASDLLSLHESMGASSTGELARRRSAASDETSRRVLLALDDISTALGGIEPFALPPQSSYGFDDKTNWTSSARRNGSPASGNQAHCEGSRRPTSALHHNHQHCQSEPIGSSDFKSMLANGRREEPDIGREGSEGAEWPRRPALDSLARSLSEHAKDGMIGGRHTASSSSSSSSTLMMHEAPLAPSALLELLNTGRTLARAH